MRARFAAALIAVGAALLSTACTPLRPLVTPAIVATDPHETIATYQGQLSIKLQAFQAQPAKGVSMGFFFQGSARRGQLDLMTPLGSQVARIHWAPGLAILSSIDKDDQQFSDIDDLSTQALGEAIPLPALMDWLQGHPSDALPAPTNATPTGFEQGGWHIGTSEITEGKLLAERPQSDTLRGVTIRIRLDR